MRVVFDTNVYVSALTLPGGRADAALSAVLEGACVLLLSEPILGETLRVLGRKFSRDSDSLAHAALFLSEIGQRVTPDASSAILQDEPDNRLLECALAGRADLVVTGDRALLRLARFENIEIVSLRTFLERVQERG